MNVYLAGPMAGQPLNNHPEFNKAADMLREREGWFVFNPAEYDQHVGIFPHTTPTKQQLREALSGDFQWLCEQADAIALLPGWQRSNGAKAELQAAIALELRVFNLMPISFQVVEIEVEPCKFQTHRKGVHVSRYGC